MRKLLCTLGVVLLGSCAGPMDTLSLSFDPVAAELINKSGNSTVSGQAFMRRNDGVVVYAAGSDIYLFASTPYADERIRKIYGTSKRSYSGTKFENDDPSYYKYMRQIRADGEGRFVFEKVAPGKYYITTTIVWMAGNWRQGGALMETVNVVAGQNINIIMTGE